jgi:ATP-binding cassette subfamily B protein
MAQSIGYAGNRKPLIYLGCALAAVAAVLGLAPYICVWQVARGRPGGIPEPDRRPRPGQLGLAGGMVRRG